MLEVACEHIAVAGMKAVIASSSRRKVMIPHGAVLYRERNSIGAASTSSSTFAGSPPDMNSAPATSSPSSTSSQL